MRRIRTPGPDGLLASDSFEDALRRAVSLGGDTDTLAAISGSLAEPYFGIPASIYKISGRIFYGGNENRAAAFRRTLRKRRRTSMEYWDIYDEKKNAQAAPWRAMIGI